MFVVAFCIQLTQYPGMTMAWIADVSVDVASTQGTYWLRTVVPINQIYTLVAVVLYSTLSADAFLWALPLFLFYTLFSVQLVVTAQMLRGRKRLGDIRTMTGLLRDRKSVV